MQNINETIVMEEMENVPSPSKIVSSSGDTEKIIDGKDLSFSRANIEALSANVRLVDNDESTGLDLFCYIHCDPTDDGLIRQCRGVVFNKDKVVMKAFPYTVEYSVDDHGSIDKNIEPIFGDCSFYDAHEGALIRMFCFDGKWFVSTHRKLNAFRSKWASRDSFGVCFKRALESEIENNVVLRESLPEGEDVIERFQNILDTEKQYMFLIRNSTDNRIVCTPPERPTLYHVGTFVNQELILTDKSINIPHPVKHDFRNVEEMCRYVNNVDPANLQGVIVFAPGNKQFKVFHREYLELFRARGNEPSIKFRYLQVRMNRKHTNMLYYLYPELTKTFDDYENNIYDIAKGIYNSYVQRFIKKNYVTVPAQEFAVIRECHAWHLENRVDNRITQNKIIEVLNKQSPTNINQMIRRFRTEQTKNIEVKETEKIRNRSNTITSNSHSVENSPVIAGIAGANEPPPIPQQKQKFFHQRQNPPVRLLNKYKQATTK